MQKLINDIRACTLCVDYLPNVPKPIFSVSEKSKILIIGQAPEQKVQNTGIPWSDQSGKKLRCWLGVDSSVFYNTDIFGIISKHLSPGMSEITPIFYADFCLWCIRRREIKYGIN